MKFEEKKVSDIKIAYIGGGSRGWAWGLMSDLILEPDMSGTVFLYDLDFEAAKANETIGNKYNGVEEAKTTWNYKAVKTIEEALDNANFVIISILPGTFDEMASDVHAPEKYGIYQPVGDTTGPGGIVRAMRTLPIYEEIAKKIKEYCPKAWVINYTNPMALCVQVMYDAFPEIKAFGCCHEVFAVQSLLAKVYKEAYGEKEIQRSEIKVNPVGVNHFTWFTEAKYQDVDIYPIYREYVKQNKDLHFDKIDDTEENWLNKYFINHNKVKFDLFERFGYIAAAGDRHLAEFSEGKWYLENPERVEKMGFGLTNIKWRKENLAERLEKGRKLLSGEEKVEVKPTGEEGILQMKALLGLIDLVTNVNIPNRGQIPNLPMGAVVETNAVFRSDSLNPVFAGAIPSSIHPLISRAASQQMAVFEGIQERNLDKIFAAFVNDPLVTCTLDEAKELFIEMMENTKNYLTMYDIEGFKNKQ